MKVYGVWLLWISSSVACSGVHALAATTRGFKVCTASPCKPNGSKLLLDALQSVSKSDVTIKEDYCLGGCCSGVVVKPLGTNTRRLACKVMEDEATAVEVAEELLRQIDGGSSGVNEDRLAALKDKIAAGERALENSEAPEICQNCGVGLQLYRGNCAKCGKYPY